jgi:hypothetical protein
MSSSTVDSEVGLPSSYHWCVLLTSHQRTVCENPDSQSWNTLSDPLLGWTLCSSKWGLGAPEAGLIA